jgi:hypothetical protein
MFSDIRTGFQGLFNNKPLNLHNLPRFREAAAEEGGDSTSLHLQAGGIPDSV